MKPNGRLNQLSLILGCLGVVLALGGGARLKPAGATTSLADKIDPQAVAVAHAEGQAPVIVTLAEQADLAAAYHITDRVARTRYVYRQLRQVAERTQPALVAWLRRRGAGVEQFFIVNAVALQADEGTLRALARWPEVSYVQLEGQVEVIDLPAEPSSGRQVEVPAWPLEPQVVERGVKAIGADKVWRMGYRGEGIVVAVTDTGAYYKHPALKSNYRGRDGDHDYDWFDAAGGASEPVDQDSHGTHVTGIAVGEAGARQIGVAPGAEWIACRLIERRSGEDGASLRCLQWVLAPTPIDDRQMVNGLPEMAPDVVNASWGARPGRGCEGAGVLRQAIANLEAAGILFVASAGNSGPGCGTICAPARWPEAFTVANYDVRRRNIASSSSRGPIKLADGELIKPDIAAPGVNINSSVPPSRYARKSGTSMSAPHVTGAVALLLSARPELRGRPELVRQMFAATASGIRPDKCGPPGDSEFNNSAGHGLIDVEAAVEVALSATPPPTPTSTATITPTPLPSLTPTNTPTPTATPVPHFDIFMPFIGRRVFFSGP